MLALYNWYNYKGLPNFAPTHSRLDSFAAVVTQRSETESCVTTLMTAAKETNISHATMSFCTGENETAGSFSGLLRV